MGYLSGTNAGELWLNRRGIAEHTEVGSAIDKSSQPGGIVWPYRQLVGIYNGYCAKREVIESECHAVEGEVVQAPPGMRPRLGMDDCAVSLKRKTTVQQVLITTAVIKKYQGCRVEIMQIAD